MSARSQLRIGADSAALRMQPRSGRGEARIGARPKKGSGRLGRLRFAVLIVRSNILLACTHCSIHMSDSLAPFSTNENSPSGSMESSDSRSQGVNFP